MRFALVVAVAALLVSPIAAAQDAAPPAALSPVVPMPVVPPPSVAPVPPVAPSPPAESVAAPAAPAPAAAYANRSGAFGVGVNIGNRVSGVSLKLWASPGVAAEAAAGGGAEGNNLRAHVGLNFSLAQWTSPDGQYLLPIYLGVGGVLGHTFASGAIPTGTAAGFRVPVGMSVLVRANPVELFFEVAPELTVASTSSPNGKYVIAADGAIGFRYYL
jgi:hypothetical protein